MDVVIVSSMDIITAMPVGGGIHVRLISSGGRFEITEILINFSRMRPSKGHCSDDYFATRKRRSND